MKHEEIERIRQAVEGAFSPLRCQAEVLDNAQYLKFDVMDDRGDVIKSFETVDLPPLKDASLLDAFLASARGRIVHAGYSLEPR